MFIQLMHIMMSCAREEDPGKEAAQLIVGRGRYKNICLYSQSSRQVRFKNQSRKKLPSTGCWSSCKRNETLIVSLHQISLFTCTSVHVMSRDLFREWGGGEGGGGHLVLIVDKATPIKLYVSGQL